MGPFGELPRRPPAAELRFRVYIDGELEDEEWLRSGDPARVDAAANRQGQLCREAEHAGRGWLLEVYDPDRAEDEAYLRIGPGSLVDVDVVIGVFPMVARMMRPDPN